MRKEKILIVDDSEMNRAILADILGEDYEIIEAENGVPAVKILQNMHNDIDLVLLDMVMPHMDGFGFLSSMNENRWIDAIPVIIISAENGAEQVERAYNMGVTDFIARPFDAFMVRHRVVNTLLLYAKQKSLVRMVKEQLDQKQEYTSMMVDILSHIVEVRNGESGLHVLHVRSVTDFLLRKLRQRDENYSITEEDIAVIADASALHDIGKMGVPSEILNKPGSFTEEEYAIMKTHTILGESMLRGETIDQENPLVKNACEICRWHHERYDGKGYPDGLKGDEIPISAQVVALADVYDALTSDRVYKKGFDHETAINMIVEGKCGAFNPILLECLCDGSNELKARVGGDVIKTLKRIEARNVTDGVLNRKANNVSEYALSMIDNERLKREFFNNATDEEIQFEYTMSSHILMLSSWSAKKLGVSDVVVNAYSDSRIHEVIGGINWSDISKRIASATPEKPDVSFECKINIGGEMRWHRVIVRTMWTKGNTPRCEGAIGRATDIHETKKKIELLKRKAARDTMTGLLRFESAERMIKEKLASEPNKNYMLALLDIDRLSEINEKFGRRFGDDLLYHIADVLSGSLRADDISSRIGNEHFMLFLESAASNAQAVRRIYSQITVPYEKQDISVSMGIAESATAGRDFGALFAAASLALDTEKKNGGGGYVFYDTSM